ncbi:MULTISPECIES: hypothetical protein [Pandoraea]|uniref:hypothetical protein n=1 Tax=Pandoraea TaxID=93217 RepID=UPI001F5C189E|nr:MULTISPECIES: hypothetical protein [Pandoraea]MCI3203538.1 hypothetical protein [Pandoraea sp. LA3]MDN4581564.1 hypothetical protein [Pandoraea capi]
MIHLNSTTPLTMGVDHATTVPAGSTAGVLPEIASTFSSARQAPVMSTNAPARLSVGLGGTRGCRISMEMLPTGVLQLSIKFPASLQTVAPLSHQQSAMGVVAGEPGSDGTLLGGSHRDPNGLEASTAAPSTVSLSGRGEPCPQAGEDDGQVEESMVQQTRSIMLRSKYLDKSARDEDSDSTSGGESQPPRWNTSAGPDSESDD